MMATRFTFTITSTSTVMPNGKLHPAIFADGPGALLKWDPVNDLGKQQKHGVSFSQAQYAFTDSSRVIAEDLESPKAVRPQPSRQALRRPTHFRTTHV